MDLHLARWLVGEQAADELQRAAADPDAGSLAAAARLRRRLSAEQAAAVAAQVHLRARARAKFGDQAATMFFTSTGLEQASRPEVSRWRAERLVAAGVQRVADLGCGIGADALAMQRAGLEVSAVERDPVTAVFASANLRVEAVVTDAVDAFARLSGEVAVFADPARRSDAGRSWRVADLSPPWEFVETLLARRVACVKLGPGLPSALIPESVAATWVSATGDLVEASLWSGHWAASRQAVLLPGGHTLTATDPTGHRTDGAVTPRTGQVLYEPDPAVIRAGLTDQLGAELAAARVHPGIAYLIGNEARPTPFATAFVVDAVLDASERSLRAWVRERGIGTLEIKKRGIEIDPAALRRRLKPKGSQTATLVLTPTANGARALAVSRVRV